MPDSKLPLDLSMRVNDVWMTSFTRMTSFKSQILCPNITCTIVLLISPNNGKNKGKFYSVYSNNMKRMFAYLLSYLNQRIITKEEFLYLLWVYESMCVCCSSLAQQFDCGAVNVSASLCAREEKKKKAVWLTSLNVTVFPEGLLASCLQGAKFNYLNDLAQRVYNYVSYLHIHGAWQRQSGWMPRRVKVDRR